MGAIEATPVVESPVVEREVHLANPIVNSPAQHIIIGAGMDKVSQSGLSQKIVGLFSSHTLKLREVDGDFGQYLTTGCSGNDIDPVFEI